MTKSPHFFSNFFWNFSHTHTQCTPRTTFKTFSSTYQHTHCVHLVVRFYYALTFVYFLYCLTMVLADQCIVSANHFFQPVAYKSRFCEYTQLCFVSTCTTFHQLASQYHWSIADMIVLVSTKWQISIIPGCSSSSSSSWVVLMSFVSNFFITPRKCSYAHDQITTFFSQIFDFLVEFSENFCWCTMTFKAQVNAF